MLEELYDLKPEEMKNLQRYPLGDVALIMLAEIVEKNLILWYLESFDNNGIDLQFYSLDLLEYADPLDNWKKVKAIDALIALAKRGYITEIPPSDMINKLNVVCQEKERAGFKQLYSFNGLPEVRRREQDNNLMDAPWQRHSNIFEVTHEGKQALLRTQVRLMKLHNIERRIAEQPKFVISARVDESGQVVPGMGSIYRVVKENATRFVVIPPHPEDGMPAIRVADSALEWEGSLKNNSRCRVLRKDRVLVTNANATIYRDLIKAQAEYYSSLKKANEEKRSALIPIQTKFESQKKDAIQEMNSAVTKAKEQTILEQDTALEQDFVIGLDEVDSLIGNPKF